MTDDVTVFLCGGPKPAPCTVPGCGRPGYTQCKFELKGVKQGQLCGRPLCSEHGGGFCPPHHRLMERVLETFE